MRLQYTTKVENGSSNDRLLNLGQVYVGHLNDEGTRYILDDFPGRRFYLERFTDVTGVPTSGSSPAGPGGMKYDDGKPRMDLLLSGCPNALEQVAQILTFGAQKYAAHSWQTVPQGEERYLAALLRHLTAHSKGEKNDPESGMSHLAHAACNTLFILELEARKCTSDTGKVD